MQCTLYDKFQRKNKLMATISRKTLGIAVECLMPWSQPEIETFLRYFVDEIPDELIYGASKRIVLNKLFKVLEENDQEDLILKILLEALPKLYGDAYKMLKNALIKDGFVIENGSIAKDVPIAKENRSALEILISQHSTDLNTEILTHHLKENNDLFRQEKWDSSISHARNFVEQLLEDIAKTIAIKRKENPDLNKPVLVRQYLQKSGFFDDSEKNKLVDGIYGYFSEEGSHPGISNQSTARVCMHIFWAFSYYVLEKFEEWKDHNI